MARISVTKQFEKKVKSSLDNYFQKLGIKAKVENQWVPFRRSIDPPHLPELP